MLTMDEQVAERISHDDGILVSVDNSWFNEKKDYYLAREDFRQFCMLSGVNPADLIDADRWKRQFAQITLARQSALIHAVRRQHAGWEFPFLVYTQAFSLLRPLPYNGLDTDRFILQLDMCDSLRRRHIALSHAVLPAELDRLSDRFGHAVAVKNYGSGAGIDVANAVAKKRKCVSEVLNIEIDRNAIKIGRKITEYLESTGRITPGQIFFQNGNFMRSGGKAHLVIAVGIICGVTDKAAAEVIGKAWEDLEEGGVLVISAANHHMREDCPLSSFVIQNVGTTHDPDNGWGLNYRKSETLASLLETGGFSNVRIYDDALYPGRESLPLEVLNSVDRLPAKAFGCSQVGKHPVIPESNILSRRVGYNWIAVAEKR